MSAIEKPWFAAKRYGLGSGLPIAWQGWAAIATFFAAFLASLRFSPQPVKTWLAIILLVAFCVLTAAKTKGGWRWRWGGED